MHPNALLELATDLLHKVLRFDAPADGVVSDFFRQHRVLGQRERHTLAETTYDVLRHRALYQHLAQSGQGEMERRLAILGWQGNAGFLRAALTVAEQQWLDRVQAVDRQALPDKLRHNLPEWLAAPLHRQLGDEFWPLVESLEHAAALDLRVNSLKAKRDDVRAALAAGRHRRHSDAVFALGTARGRQARAQQARRLHARRRRGAGRGQPACSR
jgi:16S rRNA (cytosine967-C5)-methyltransferase